MNDDTAEPGRRPLAGVRVIELASGQMVPACGAMLADWGADVITVPLPASVVVARPEATSMSTHLNRGKRSAVMDVGRAEGLELLYSMSSRADVFLTSLTASERTMLSVDVGDIRASNPGVIYARGSGLGPRGAERDHAAVDHASYWSRGGVAEAFRKLHAGIERPLSQPSGFGELPSGALLAGGVAAALLRRSLHGESSVVDVSLLGFSVWHLFSDVVTASTHPQEATVVDPGAGDRLRSPNPFVNIFRTADDRFVTLCVLQGDRFAADVFDRIGRPDLARDARFASGEARFVHREALTRELDDTFATRTLADWSGLLAGTEWVWETVAPLPDAITDVQNVLNHSLVHPNGDPRAAVVAGPVQFDEGALSTDRAPKLGEHTASVLAELGIDQDRRDALEQIGVIGHRVADVRPD